MLSKVTDPQKQSVIGLILVQPESITVISP